MSVPFVRRVEFAESPYPYTIAPVVWGGDDQAIAEMIYIALPAVIGTIGTVSTTIDGATISFSRPQPGEEPPLRLRGGRGGGKAEELRDAIRGRSFDYMVMDDVLGTERPKIEAAKTKTPTHHPRFGAYRRRHRSE